MKNQGLKILFGLIIFLFGTALAYFTANYLRSNNIFDYWGAIAIFAGAYVLVGIIIAAIYSVSLGFLFAADVLLIHLLVQYYGQWADMLKFLIIGVILIILYSASWMRLKDKSVMA